MIFYWTIKFDYKTRKINHRHSKNYAILSKNMQYLCHVPLLFEMYKEQTVYDFVKFLVTIQM